MGMIAEIKPENKYQVHHGGIFEIESDDSVKYIKDFGHIESKHLTDYYGLSVTDITAESGYEYESIRSNSTYNLVQTEYGEFLIVHNKAVLTS